jgi:outer membrane biosynthesis protein TonB
MQLGRALLEVLEAIPDRIEVSGHEPTWKVTGGSFDAAAAFADEAFAGAVVVDRRDRDRWWPRVTLTVTTDPALAATAPPREELAAEPEPDPEPHPEPDPDPEPEPEPEPEPAPEPEPVPVQGRDADAPTSVLEDMFAYQEDVRLARQRVPQQRRRHARRRV